jgi:hypothetical protein
VVRLAVSTAAAAGLGAALWPTAVVDSTAVAAADSTVAVAVVFTVVVAGTQVAGTEADTGKRG